MHTRRNYDIYKEELEHIALINKPPVKQKDRLLIIVSWGGILPLMKSGSVWIASINPDPLLISWILSYKSTKAKW